MKIILTALLILLTVNLVLAYNITITPDSYDWKYQGGEKILGFRVCHDANNTNLSIPIVTEITADNLASLQYVKVQAPYKVDTYKCKNADIKLTSTGNYTATRVILKMYALQDKNTIKLDTTKAVNNLNIVANKTNLTVKNLTILNDDLNLSNNSTVIKKPNRPVQIIAVILIVVAILGGIYYYYTQSEGGEAQN
jgi:hypothetical protein